MQQCDCFPEQVCELMQAHSHPHLHLQQTEDTKTQSLAQRTACMMVQSLELLMALQMEDAKGGCVVGGTADSACVTAQLLELSLVQEMEDMKAQLLVQQTG